MHFLSVLGIFICLYFSIINSRDDYRNFVNANVCLVDCIESNVSHRHIPNKMHYIQFKQAARSSKAVRVLCFMCLAVNTG